MTDYTDLKRRLADGFPTKQGFSGYYPDVATCVATMAEAAAAIAALEAERDALRGKVDARSIIENADDRILVGLVMQLTGGAANPAAVLAKISEARAALTPR
jgi:hypothetical protein